MKIQINTCGFLPKYIVIEKNGTLTYCDKNYTDIYTLIKSEDLWDRREMFLRYCDVYVDNECLCNYDDLGSYDNLYAEIKKTYSSIAFKNSKEYSSIIDRLDDLEDKVDKILSILEEQSQN